MDSASPGEPVRGQCSECVDQFEKAMKKFSRTYNGARRIKGETPELELPNLAPELQTEFGMDEPGFTAPDERDEYWK